VPEDTTRQFVLFPGLLKKLLVAKLDQPDWWDRMALNAVRRASGIAIGTEGHVLIGSRVGRLRLHARFRTLGGRFSCNALGNPVVCYIR
jgi:hypothetical protein